MTDEEQHAGAPPKRSRFKRYAALFGAFVLVVVLLIRWLPTSSYDGNIQRVYEKLGEFRVEVETLQGEVLVFTNSEMRFPYLKFDTADLQANLDRYEREGDLVRVKVWGFRSAVFSAFPNIVSVEQVAAGDAIRRDRTQRITRAVMAELRARRLVPEGQEEELSESLRQAIEEADHEPRSQ